ncbi:CRP-like cAMP-binding protein [Hydrogenoanaerobacterium saccharovorans]|uniref:cAMP-binding domain of CRP or a regulatory subunit of cAMP-dependent protein kinases n=1 Tax=Hydrogenoanaerobacterium saccharovorans TaxID=474960 RepID=A0A1H8A340_9FIRM|nr:Crp/Fnr family transcriptional regulator [Hydrogenoanaerobacterium saccharovorans]RPF48240.1 CRP-like cAMP-binding protein [Hydrogenoanaerobacterium saccharovorans]SEM64258.1 cAMP-binding domain of CRP or a regulatory subunit of cAMP-dependent protein kinases [Hydrogenoanaerobacterium saccharovorans]
MDVPFFTGVNQSVLKQINILPKKYTKGMTVHAQGEICKSMDIVLSGNLVAYALSQNGSENVIFEFQKNSIIGANLLFGNANHYPMNIYCTEDSELLHINKSDVELLLHDYQFTINFVKSISLNSQGMNKKITIYTQKSLRENLLDYFSALAAEQNSKAITLSVSKKQLADYFGVQRPSLFRELKQMKDEGLIKIDNRQIEILD